MPVRTRAILIGLGFLVLALLWFFFLFRPNQDRIAELRDQQATETQQIDQLRIRLAELERLRDQEPMLRAQMARFQDALPEDPRLPDFILQIEEQANLAGIDFLAITPSLPSPFTPAAAPGAAAAPPAGGAAQIQQITVTVSTTGRYFELLDFILRLERQLPRAVRVNTFALSPTGEAAGRGQSPTLSVSFQMQMFMVSPAPIDPSAAPPAGQPPPSVTPAPPAETPAPAGETPAPAGETPAPTPVPGG